MHNPTATRRNQSYSSCNLLSLIVQVATPINRQLRKGRVWESFNSNLLSWSIQAGVSFGEIQTPDAGAGADPRVFTRRNMGVKLCDLSRTLNQSTIAYEYRTAQRFPFWSGRRFWSHRMDRSR